jgi:hypothetical protein
MKKIFLIILAVAGLGLLGCEENSTHYVTVDTIPAVPQGVYSLTGDNAVYLFWLPVRESDLDLYRIYWSPNDTDFYFLGSSTDEEYVDYDVQNGTTYFYAVTAVDIQGNESPLSYESVMDTPRPEGRNLLIADYNIYPEIAGYDFSTDEVVPDTSVNADIYLEYNQYDSVFYINVNNELTDIQDMGYTDTLSDIGYAPSEGWSEVGWSEVILGHTYIIWTKDNHFAMLRVTNLTAPYNVRFDWAYQTDPGNRELARPQHDQDYLKRTIKSTLIK